MADLCLTYAEIVDLVETFMGWTSPSTDNKAWALDRVNEGLRRFIKAQYYDEDSILRTHVWNFLQTTSNLTVTKGVSTADGVPVDAGGSTTTVNVDDAIFNSTQVGAQVVFTATGNAYIIATYTDTTTVVVTGDATGEADADTVTIIPHSLALPDNFGGMVQPITFLYDGGTLYDLYERDYDEMIAVLSRDDQTAGTPEYYCILSVEVPTATTVQKWKIILQPTPDAAKTIGYRYRIRVDRAADDTKMPPGGADFCDAIVECARAAAEYKSGGKTTGQQEARANAAMRAAVRFDEELHGEAHQEHVHFSDDDTG